MSIVKNFPIVLRETTCKHNIYRTKIEEEIEKVTKQNIILRKQNARLKHQIGVIRIQSMIQIVKLEKTIQMYKRILENQTELLSQSCSEDYGSSCQSLENIFAKYNKQSVQLFNQQRTTKQSNFRHLNSRDNMFHQESLKKHREYCIENMQRVFNPQQMYEVQNPQIQSSLVKHLKNGQQQHLNYFSDVQQPVYPRLQKTKI